MTTIHLNELGLLSALGQGKELSLQGLLEGQSRGMRATQRYSPGKELYLGEVEGELGALGDQHPLRRQSRNNRLLLSALSQIRPQVEAAIKRYGKGRLGIVL